MHLRGLIACNYGDNWRNDKPMTLRQQLGIDPWRAVGPSASQMDLSNLFGYSAHR